MNLKTTGALSENAEKTIPEAFITKRRAKSAPIVSQVPTQRIVLKIPTPQLQNLFSVDNDDQASTSSSEKNIFDNSDVELDNSRNNFKITDIVPQEQIKLLNLNENSQVIITHTTSNIEQKLREEQEMEKNENLKSDSKNLFKKVIVVANRGKKPMVADERPKESEKFIIRPKTANVTFRRTGSSLSRSKSNVEKSKIDSTSVKNPVVELISNPEVEPEKSITLQQILKLNTGQSDQPSGTQFQYNHFYNNKTQNVSQSSDPNVIFIDPAWVDNYLKAKKQQRQQKSEYKLIDGHWKDQLLNRRYETSIIFSY